MGDNVYFPNKGTIIYVYKNYNYLPYLLGKYCADCPVRRWESHCSINANVVTKIRELTKSSLAKLLEATNL